jgi:hypothetical protein
MLEVMGLVARVFPTHISAKVPEVLPWIEDALEKQFATNAPEMLLLNGLLEALANLLVIAPGNYEGTNNDGKKRKLYLYVEATL